MFFNIKNCKRNNVLDGVDDTIKEAIEYFSEEEVLCDAKQAKKGQKARNVEESDSRVNLYCEDAWFGNIRKYELNKIVQIKTFQEKEVGSK